VRIISLIRPEKNLIDISLPYILQESLAYIMDAILDTGSRHEGLTSMVRSHPITLAMPLHDVIHLCDTLRAHWYIIQPAPLMLTSYIYCVT